MSERGEALSVRERETAANGRSLTVLGILYFGVDSISEEVVGFSPFMVYPRINTVFIVSCVVLMFYCCACYSLSKDPNIMLC